MSMSFNEDAAVIAFEFIKQGARRLFVMLEFSGVERDRYLKILQKNLVTVGSTTTVKDIEGMQAGLLVLCCREVTSIDHRNELPTAEALQKALDNGELSVEHLQMRNLDIAEVQGWPSTAQGKLFTRSQELNGLTKEAREQEKKD